MMAAGTAHDSVREHSTVTRSDQAELRRDARPSSPVVKTCRASLSPLMPIFPRREGRTPYATWRRFHYPVTIFLRPARRHRCPHISQVGRRLPDAPRPRPTRGKAEPRWELEPQLPSPGLGGTGVSGPRPFSTDSASRPWSAEPMGRRDGAHDAKTRRPLISPTRGWRKEIEDGLPRAGLEPATSRSSVSHSPKLSYRGSFGPMSQERK